jgi:hypothetical protein
MISFPSDLKNERLLKSLVLLQVEALMSEPIFFEGTTGCDHTSSRSRMSPLYPGTRSIDRDVI